MHLPTPTTDEGRRLFFSHSLHPCISCAAKRFAIAAPPPFSLCKQQTLHCYTAPPFTLHTASKKDPHQSQLCEFQTAPNLPAELRPHRSLSCVQFPSLQNYMTLSHTMAVSSRQEKQIVPSFARAPVQLLIVMHNSHHTRLLISAQPAANRFRNALHPPSSAFTIIVIIVITHRTRETLPSHIWIACDARRVLFCQLFNLHTPHHHHITVRLPPPPIPHAIPKSAPEKHTNHHNGNTTNTPSP